MANSLWFNLCGMLLMGLMGFGIGNIADHLPLIRHALWSGGLMVAAVIYLIWAVYDEWKEQHKE